VEEDGREQGCVARNARLCIERRGQDTRPSRRGRGLQDCVLRVCSLGALHRECLAPGQWRIEPQARLHQPIPCADRGWGKGHRAAHTDQPCRSDPRAFVAQSHSARADHRLQQPRLAAGMAPSPIRGQGGRDARFWGPHFCPCAAQVRRRDHRRFLGNLLIGRSSCGGRNRGAGCAHVQRCVLRACTAPAGATNACPSRKGAYAALPSGRHPRGGFPDGSRRNDPRREPNYGTEAEHELGGAHRSLRLQPAADRGGGT